MKFSFTRYIKIAKNHIFYLTRVRWKEYAGYLKQALKNNYRVISLEDWFLNREFYKESKVFVLRHDVDQYPAAAQKMNEIEKSLNVHSTFYFRWHTADKAVIQQIRNYGSTVGLHYETLTRYAMIHGIRKKEQVTKQVIKECQEILKEEIEVFQNLFGRINSIAAHGCPIENQIGTRNEDLMRGEKCEDYGILFDASNEQIMAGVNCQIVDNSGYEVYWQSGMSPSEALNTGHQVILFHTHPQHWGWSYRLILWDMLSRRLLNLSYLVRGDLSTFVWYIFRSKYRDKI